MSRGAGVEGRMPRGVARGRSVGVGGIGGIGVRNVAYIKELIWGGRCYKSWPGVTWQTGDSLVRMRTPVIYSLDE